MAKKLTLEKMPDNTIAGNWGDLTANEALELLIGGIEELEADRLYQGRPGPGLCVMAALWLGSENCREEVKENLRGMQHGKETDD